MLVDVAGPTPFALTGAELLLLGAVARTEDMDGADPIVVRAVQRVLRSVAPDGDLHVDFEPAPGQPVKLRVGGVWKVSEREAIVDRLSRDPVLHRLLPRGLRVAFTDTP
jgi:hypothetical protein